MATQEMATSEAGSSSQRSSVVGYFEDDVPRYCQMAHLINNGSLCPMVLLR